MLLAGIQAFCNAASGCQLKAQILRFGKNSNEVISMASSSLRLTEQMRLMNNQDERARASNALTPLREELRPVSTSSSLALELKQQEDDLRNERAIAAMIEQDFETKSEEKPEEIPSVTKKMLPRKVPELDAKLATSNLKSLFSKLPSTVLAHNISSCIDDDLKTQVVLTQTCQRLRPFFQPALTEPRVKQLLQHIAYGQEDEAKKIIASNPNLLMMRGTVKDYSGNTIEEVTPLELAYGAEDIDMCQMLLPFLDRLPGGREEALKQMQARFPESKEEEKPYDFKPLVADIRANNNVEAAFEKFREDFKPRVIKKGKHCNVQALLDAMKVYDDNYDDNDDLWSAEQCSLLWCQVIGYLQRMLPACYAQAFCQGLYNVTDDKQPLKRSLRMVDGFSFYPADPTSRVGIGFDFGVYSYVAGCGKGGADPILYVDFRMSMSREEVTKLMSGKNIRVAKLMHQPKNPSKSRCVIL